MALTPDVEALVAAALRDSSEVAAIVGARVGGRTPSTTALPWVRITQLDDEVEASVLHLVTVHLQLDCYAGSEQPGAAHEQASLLARTVRAALAALPLGVHDEGVVCGVRFGGTQRLPDDTLTPPRERFVLAASVSVHP